MEQNKHNFTPLMCWDASIFCSASKPTRGAGFWGGEQESCKPGIVLSGPNERTPREKQQKQHLVSKEPKIYSLIIFFTILSHLSTHYQHDKQDAHVSTPWATRRRSLWLKRTYFSYRRPKQQPKNFTHPALTTQTVCPFPNNGHYKFQTALIVFSRLKSPRDLNSLCETSSVRAWKVQMERRALRRERQKFNAGISGQKRFRSRACADGSSSRQRKDPTTHPNICHDPC